jgi:hypothetical protein
MILPAVVGAEILAAKRKREKTNRILSLREGREEGRLRLHSTKWQWMSPRVGKRI